MSDSSSSVSEGGDTPGDLPGSNNRASISSATPSMHSTSTLGALPTSAAINHHHPEPKGQGHVARRKGSEWEILGNLEQGVTYSIKPRRYEGFLSKKRKWPLKGWHKRYEGIVRSGKRIRPLYLVM